MPISNYPDDRKLPPESKIPPEAHYYLDGLFYRIGSHKLPFLFVGHDWVKSGKTNAQIMGGVKL